MTEPGSHSIYNRSEKSLLVLSFVALIMLAMIYSYVSIRQNQNALLNEIATDIENTIFTSLVESRTIMHAMAGVHYSSQFLVGGPSEDMAGRLIFERDYINFFARFARVNEEGRPSFEGRMSEQGFYNYKIYSFDSKESDDLTEFQPLEFYYPVVSVIPRSFVTEKYSGLDFGSIPEFQSSIQDSITTNQIQYVPMESRIVGTSAIAMIQPLYFGNLAPEEKIERIQQFQGGYLLSLDLAKLLDYDADEFGLDALINVRFRRDDSSDFDQIYTKRLINSDSRFLESVFDRKSKSRSIPLGGAELKLSVFSRPGFTVESAIQHLLLTALVLALWLLLVAISYNRKQTRMTKERTFRAIYLEREKAERTLNSISDLVLAVTLDKEISYINKTAEAHFDLDLSLVRGKAVSDVLRLTELENPDSSFDLEAKMGEQIDFEDTEYLVSSVKSNGEVVALNISLTTMLDTEGQKSGYIAVFRDVSKERLLHSQLEYQANHDALTGCFNRYYFENILTRLIEDSQETGREHALIYIDLDQFKVVNDTCGHAAGDQLLRELTNNLRQHIRSKDVFARLGGDEFGLIIVDLPRASAKYRAEKLHEFFQTCVFEIHEKVFPIRASLGFVSVDKNSGSLKDVQSAADIACYMSKDSGRNLLSVYSAADENINKRTNEKSLLPKLQEAIEKDQFRLLVQPLVDISGKSDESSRVSHYEFLIRLLQDDGTESSPLQYIQLAERYDQMKDIDRWVIREGISIASDMVHKHGLDCTFSINISGQSSADPGLLEFIQQQFELCQLDPSRIWIEITETAAISRLSVAQDLFTSLQALGVQVALDDFGSGLSSFGYLKKFPVDVIKIDGQFVKDIGTSAVDEGVVRAIYSVAQSLDIVTVAEYVADESGLEILRKIGIDYAQGYFVGKPCSIESALKMYHGISYPPNEDDLRSAA